MNVDRKIYTIDEIKNNLLPIKDKYGIKFIYLFGSYARNEAGVDSDIDLILERGNVKTLIDLYFLNESLKQTFNKKVDVLIEDEVNKEFIEEIRKDMIRLC